MRDIQEQGQRIARSVRLTAAQFMPSPRQLEVIDATTHAAKGWVFCTLEGSRVRCIVPANLDLSGAVDGTAKYVLWALPLTGEEGSSEYFALGLAWNGVDNSRAPALMMAGGSFQPSSSSTPEEGVRLNANDEGQLLATSQNGTQQVINDDTVQWLNYLA